MGFMDWLSEKAKEVEDYRQGNIAKQGTEDSWYSKAADSVGAFANDVAANVAATNDSIARGAGQLYSQSGLGGAIDAIQAAPAEVEAYIAANKEAYNKGTSRVAQAKQAYEDMMLSMRPQQGPQTWRDQTIAAQSLQPDPGMVALPGAFVAKKGLGKVGQLYDDLFKGTKQLKVPTGDITKGVKQSEFPMHPSRKKAIFNKAIADQQDKQAMEIMMAERAAGNNARNYGRDYFGL